MKLKTRIILSLFLLAMLPLFVNPLVLVGVYKYETGRIDDKYGIEGTDYSSLSNPVEILRKAADMINDEVEETIKKDARLLDNIDYWHEKSKKLSEKSTDIVVIKNNEYIFISSGINKSTADEILPHYDAYSDDDRCLYYGGDKNCLIRQITAVDEVGDMYTISLITYVKDIIPMIKRIWKTGYLIAFIAGIVIVCGCSFWIYMALIKPVRQLSEATKKISEGNLDFKINETGDLEMRSLCRDFEFMRQKLMQSANDSLIAEKENKELISNISHDLKTPITAIKGYVEGLKDGIADTAEKQEKYLQTIYNKAVAMDKLIDELTLYSKIDTNKIPYTFKKMGVRDYFDDLKDSLCVELESKNVQFDYDNQVKADELFVVDPEQMGRVINNIISNSLKYHSEENLKIAMIISDDGDFFKVSISDNGIGISKKDIEHVFDRLYRADASRNSATGGSGIGLSIVKKIIEDHGGKIWAESEVSKGTTMNFVLRKYYEGQVD